MINITRRFICDKCGKSVGEHRNVRSLEEDKPPCFIPEGWKQIGDTLICKEHKIEKITFIDGKEVL